jgi:hypothetical protein
MTAKLKAFGLVLVAAFAFSALAASAASAAEPHSGSASGTTYLTGTQIGTNQLDTEGGNIKCSTVGLSASYAGTTAAQVKVIPAYSGCTAYGLTAHVEMNGCYYLLTSAASTIDVECEAGKGPITIKPTQGGVAVCTVDVAGSQTVPTKVTNIAGTPDDLTLTPESSTIKYTVTYPTTGTKCGAAGAHSDGTYTGSVTAQAYENPAHTAQVNLTYN